LTIASARKFCSVFWPDFQKHRVWDKNMGILAVGSIAFDKIKTPYGARDEVLGGSLTYFSIAASHFAPVSIVAVVGDDFPEEEIAFLQGRGIDTAGLQRQKGKTFRWEAEYETNINIRRTLATHLNVFANFSPQVLEQHRNHECLFLGNIDPDLQQSVLKQMKRPKIVACDTMNYWIDNRPESLRQILSMVDILLINDSETCEIAGETNLVKASRKVRSMGPKTLVVKRGEFGVLMFNGGSVFSAPGFPVEDVVDPTGAGDSFAGGFMGSLACVDVLDDAALRRAIIYGSVLASFSIRDFGPHQLGRLTQAEIEERFSQFHALTWFEALPLNNVQEFRS
jgi:sugar/nucleoside kinase (ribokinase family)